MSIFGSIFGSISSSFRSSNITWYCDGCHAVMNDQPGFDTSTGIWECTECGELNDVTDDNVFGSEEEYQTHMGIPRCPICGGMVVGDAPDATYWFNCPNCNVRFCLKDGELCDPFAPDEESGRTCEYCGKSLSGGEFAAPWEDGDNPCGYVRCPHCWQKNYFFED